MQNIRKTAKQPVSRQDNIKSLRGRNSLSNTIIKPEVLAPAGDRERLEAAILYGADAVYLGGTQYGMRAASASFDADALKSAVDFAHSHNVKVYLTCNTLPRNQEMDEMPEFLHMAQKCGIDALIVTDIGVLGLVKETTPEMEIHISTQAGIVNYRAASEFFRMGAKRVVLARELRLEEIAEIREKTPPELEIEAFVHGAMCVSVSGRCLLSNYLTARDANRGECAQPCRWAYHLMEEKRQGQYFPIFEDERGTYILNAKDLCMLEHIDKLINAGVSSLKIEGRAKSSYYVSVVTNAYRCAVDSFLQSPDSYQPPQWILEEVKKVSHRQYSTGFFFGRPEQGQYYENGGYLRNYEVVAIADSYANGKLLVTQRNKFMRGDTVEVLEPHKPPFQLEITAITEAGEAVEAACHPMAQITLDCPHPVVKGAILRRATER